MESENNYFRESFLSSQPGSESRGQLLRDEISDDFFLRVPPVGRLATVARKYAAGVLDLAR